MRRLSQFKNFVSEFQTASDVAHLNCRNSSINSHLLPGSQKKKRIGDKNHKTLELGRHKISFKFSSDAGKNTQSDSVVQNACLLSLMRYQGNQSLLLRKYNIKVKVAGTVQGMKPVCYDLDLFICNFLYINSSVQQTTNPTRVLWDLV